MPAQGQGFWHVLVTIYHFLLVVCLQSLGCLGIESEPPTIEDGTSVSCFTGFTPSPPPWPSRTCLEGPFLYYVLFSELKHVGYDARSSHFGSRSFTETGK